MVPIDRPKNSASYMSASKISTRILRPQSKKYKYAVGFSMSRCNISVKQNFKIFNLTDFIVHKVCRKKFIDKNYIYTSKVCGELKTQKRVLRKELTFNHRTNCFLCGTEVVINEKHDDRSPKSYLVQTKEISMSMIKYCDSRKGTDGVPN